MDTRLTPDIMKNIRDKYDYAIVQHLLAESYKELHWNDKTIAIADFFRNLEGTLRKYNIYLYSGILQDYLFDIFELDTELLGVYTACRFKPFNLEIQNGWGFELREVLDFFISTDIPPMNEALLRIPLASKQVLVEISSRLKSWIETLPAWRLDLYQLKSVSVFVANSRTKTRSLAFALMTELNSKGETIETSDGKLLLKISQIYGLCSIPSDQSQRMLASTIVEYRDMLQSNTCPKQAVWLLGHLEDYYCSNIRHKCIKVIHENLVLSLEDLLESRKISCDYVSGVVGETLLVAAGIDLPKHSRVLDFMPDNNNFRLHCMFNNFSLQSIQQLANFLHQHDKTVNMYQDQYNPHWAHSPKDWPHIEKGYYPVIVLSMNAEVFYTTIFPIFKETFLHRVSNHDPKIAIYQEYSKSVFEPNQEFPLNDGESDPDDESESDIVRLNSEDVKKEETLMEERSASSAAPSKKGLFANSVGGSSEAVAAHTSILSNASGGMQGVQGSQ